MSATQINHRRKCRGAPSRRELPASHPLGSHTRLAKGALYPRERGAGACAAYIQHSVPQGDRPEQREGYPYERIFTGVRFRRAGAPRRSPRRQR